MQDAQLYSRSNALQIVGAQRLFHEHHQLVKKWKNVPDLRLLDIGCGEGDVLVKVILETVGPNYVEVCGIDILPDMIRMASEKYGSMEKVKFVNMDIETGDEESVVRLGQFNLVTSFYCFNWVRDQAKAFANIFSLLESKGELFLVLVRSCIYTSVYRKLSTNPNWVPYTKDWQKYPCDIYGDLDWKQKLEHFLNEAGFVEYEVKLATQKYEFQTKQELRDELQSINPFIHRMPHAVRNQFMDELLAVYLEFIPRLELSYEVIVLHATKQ